MAKDTKSSVDVAAVLASADLDELNGQIAERETAIKRIEGEIYSLKLVRRSVEAFKNGRPAKVWSRKKKGAAAVDDAPVVRIKRFLDKIGAAGVPAITRETGLTQAIVAATLQERQEVFICKPGGIWKLR
jgi:hypothetical protein